MKRPADVQTFIGDPCRRCGSSVRYLLGKNLCVACHRARGTGITPDDKEKWLALQGGLSPCRKCGSTNRGERAGECRDCVSARSKAWRDENREYAIKRTRAYYHANAEELNKRKAERMTPERSAAKNANDRRYRAENSGKLDVAKLKWVQLNRERIRVYKRNNKSKRRQAEGTLSTGIAQQLFKLQRGKCACCKKPLGKDYHLDHRIALARGGTNTDDNMQLLRARCNTQKGAKDPIDFMQSRGFLL